MAKHRLDSPTDVWPWATVLHRNAPPRHRELMPHEKRCKCVVVPVLDEYDDDRDIDEAAPETFHSRAYGLVDPSPAPKPAGMYASLRVEYQALGIDPALVDLLGERGRHA